MNAKTKIFHKIKYCHRGKKSSHKVTFDFCCFLTVRLSDLIKILTCVLMEKFYPCF